MTCTVYPRLLLVLLLALVDCAYQHPYTDCQQDTDCPMIDGKQQFCTADQLCVDGTPKDELCTALHPENPVAGAIPIGAILHLETTNPMVNEKIRLQTLQLAVDEVNFLARSGGKPVVLHVCDAFKRAPNASIVRVNTIKAMKVLLEERKVMAVIGPNSSDQVFDVAGLVTERHVPLISPSATSPTLSTLPDPGYVFRAAPSDTAQAVAMAGLVAREQKLALVFSDDSFGKGFQQAFLAAWVDPNKRNMPSESASYTAFNRDSVTAAAKAAINSNPTAVVAIAGGDTQQLVKDLAMLAPGVPIYMTSSSKNRTVLDLIGILPMEHMQRIFGTAPIVAVGTGVHASFVSAFQGRYMQDPASTLFTFYTYDAFYAVSIALGSLQEEVSGMQISRALQRILSSGQPSVGVGQGTYLEAVRLLQAGAVTLQGTTGPVGFTSRGERGGALFEKWGINVGTKAFTSTPL